MCFYKTFFLFFQRNDNYRVVQYHRSERLCTIEFPCKFLFVQLILHKSFKNKKHEKMKDGEVLK